jgi:hypothetical protein
LQESTPSLKDRGRVVERADAAKTFFPAPATMADSWREHDSVTDWIGSAHMPVQLINFAGVSRVFWHGVDNNPPNTTTIDSFLGHQSYRNKAADFYTNNNKLNNNDKQSECRSN